MHLRIGYVNFNALGLHHLAQRTLELGEVWSFRDAARVDKARIRKTDRRRWIRRFIGCAKPAHDAILEGRLGVAMQILTEMLTVRDAIDITRCRNVGVNSVRRPMRLSDVQLLIDGWAPWGDDRGSPHSSEIMFRTIVRRAFELGVPYDEFVAKHSTGIYGITAPPVIYRGGANAETEAALDIGKSVEVLMRRISLAVDIPAHILFGGEPHRDGESPLHRSVAAAAMEKIRTTEWKVLAPITDHPPPSPFGPRMYPRHDAVQSAEHDFHAGFDLPSGYPREVGFDTRSGPIPNDHSHVWGTPPMRAFGGAAILPVLPDDIAIDGNGDIGSTYGEISDGLRNAIRMRLQTSQGEFFADPGLGVHVFVNPPYSAAAAEGWRNALTGIGRGLDADERLFAEQHDMLDRSHHEIRAAMFAHHPHPNCRCVIERPVGDLIEMDIRSVSSFPIAPFTIAESSFDEIDALRGEHADVVIVDDPQRPGDEE